MLVAFYLPLRCRAASLPTPSLPPFSLFAVISQFRSSSSQMSKPFWMLKHGLTANPGMVVVKSLYFRTSFTAISSK
ncbi:hypothetical protein BY996DRAFT_8116675 [Phakopsora pachyrhizi]|nr:hypothetical protein BY996DRAFT_8116675 [Phakopsora pachyrhizi]